MRTEYIIGIILVVLLAAGLVFLLYTPSENSSAPLDAGGKAYVEIADPSGFVNTDGITIGGLVGKKVILVDFMTYSCINCQRTFPYLTAWYEKYKDQGLEIVGIHTPEFAFEKDIANVREAMKRHEIAYPVVLDNNYATWRAYGNNYWPRKYLIDIRGRIVYDHIGEGAYEETEMKIRDLLRERASVLGEANPAADDFLVASRMPEGEKEVGSPEIYFGSARNERLGNGKKFSRGVQVFEAPKTVLLNTLYLEGNWNIEEEYAENREPGKIVFRYRAANVFMVAGAKMPVEVDVVKDNRIIKTIRILEDRLYSLVEDADAGERTLELRVKGPGLQAFTFTFG